MQDKVFVKNAIQFSSLSYFESSKQSYLLKSFYTEQHSFIRWLVFSHKMCLVLTCSNYCMFCTIHTLQHESSKTREFQTISAMIWEMQRKCQTTCENTEISSSIIIWICQISFAVHVQAKVVVKDSDVNICRSARKLC